MMIVILSLAAAFQAVPPAEAPVDPYDQSNANAGAGPFSGTAMLDAFHGRAGINRIVEDLVVRATTDKRIAEILEKQDLVRLRRLLKEQFCYILNGNCDYSGRAMKAGHKDL